MTGNPNHDEKGRFAEGHGPGEKFSAASILSDEQPLAQAYHAGRDAYHKGMSETDHMLQPPHSDEFVRGYKIARKEDKFKKTIQKRRDTKKE